MVNTDMAKVASGKGGVREETLANRLAEGPLPLPVVLRFATDVAAALRELHEVARGHGEVSTATVVLRPPGAALLPPNGLQRMVDLPADVAAFGAVLYEMLTGVKPPRDGSLAAPQERVPRAGFAGLRAAATRLAVKCLAAPPDQAPTIQMVVTEVRLLNVLAQQSGADSPTAPRGAPASETRGKAKPPADWNAVGEPAEKPAHSSPSESFVGGVPTKDFVSAMLSSRHAPSPAPQEPDAKPPEKNPDGGQEVEEESGEKAPTPLDRCPKCGSRQIHRSHPRTKLEIVGSGLGIPICRCHRCFYRYVVLFRFAFSKTMPPE